MKKDLLCVWQKKLSLRSKILVSSCLVGNRVRYDGQSKSYDLTLLDDYDFVICCPEVDGGLPIPRAKSEIKSDGRVINIKDKDVSYEFNMGANIALKIAKEENIKVAILKSKSPSCSNKLVYDGTFSGKLVEGKGVTVKLLEKNGVKVFDENEIVEALRYLKELNL